MAQKASPRLTRPRSVWALIASVVYFLGAAIAFGTASAKLDGGTTPKELETWLIIFVIIGLLLSGVGQLISASAHGASSRAGARYDGWGKIVSLFGWSLGLTGATFLYIKGTDTPEWILGVTATVVFAPPILTVLWSLISEPENKEPPERSDGYM